MWSIFKDNNEWNEKNVVGFIAFLVMVLKIPEGMGRINKGTY